MKIGILGGTFNPPHLGHKNILCQSIEKLSLDMVLVIPNNIPSHKKLPKNTATTENRIEMCEIMCRDVEKAQVSLVEIEIGGESYTVQTLRELHKIHSNDEFYLIVGTDSFVSFEKWYLFEEILSLCTLTVLERNLKNENKTHKEYLEKKYNIKIELIDSDVVEISSSEIRSLQANHLLEPEILKYIEKNGLYKE
ncbi:MAG: nicotinate (nicotinamide) nucleotide adenylyltransferase [Clostridia bacterium]